MVSTSDPSFGQSILPANNQTYNGQESTPIPRNFDLCIHLGEARGWSFITIERMAFKQGFTSNWWGAQEESAYYCIPDDKAQTIKDLGPSPWDDIPMGLQGLLDSDVLAEHANAVLNSWYCSRQSRDSLPSTEEGNYSIQQVQDPDISISNNIDVDRDHLLDLGAKFTRAAASKVGQPDPIKVRPHRESGSYCCGFTHYESLANCYVNRKLPNVLFCHVPGEGDKQSLERSKQGVLAIIVSAGNEVAKQLVDV